MGEEAREGAESTVSVEGVTRGEGHTGRSRTLERQRELEELLEA